MSRRLLTSQRASSLIRDVPQRASQRKALHLTSRRHAAIEFPMPAMSPTMTEGNITSWKVSEGEKFSAGDVLLEIETDKAQMDVEAQDDGIMAKIIEQTGAKAVKVGTRIAITAGLDDNLQELDLEAFSSHRMSTENKESPPQDHVTKSQETSGSFESSNEPRRAARNPDSRYPLFPSVIQLLHQNGLAASKAAEIPASGPNGRLLKGDVLAYLGIIKADYSSQQSKRIEEIGHLDLSNIEKAAVTQTSDAAQLKKSIREDNTKNTSAAVSTEVTLPISLTAVHDVRQRLHGVLGVDVPIETFVARAASVCNEKLPPSVLLGPTTDELFNMVLGISQSTIRSRSKPLVPRIQAVGISPIVSRTVGHRGMDALDELISSPKPQKQSQRRAVSNFSSTRDSWFSVTVSAGDEARAKTFLQRLKTVLQVEPGRLVL